MVDPIRIGRYVVGGELAAGGMASVFLGRMSGPAGFGKTVAIKRMHAQFAKDADFIEMFLDEARITSGLAHPNIVLTLDVLEQPGDLLLVMEYIHGGSLAALMRGERGFKKVPPGIISAVVSGALTGLQIAHEARADDGESLHIVHRDVSPQNILISVDGVAKIADFGIAKAVGQVHSTSEGTTKGKQSYMAPEQAKGELVTPRADIFAMGIVLWESLVGRRLVPGNSGQERLHNLLTLNPAPPSSLAPELPRAIDGVVLRALAHDPNARFGSANEMALALERVLAPSSAREVGEWVRAGLADDLAERDAKLAELQRWCRANAPEVPSVVRDIAIFPSADEHVVEATKILEYPQPPTLVRARHPDSGHSETAIATERDVTAIAPPRAPPAPPKPNAAIIAAGIGFGILGAIGVILAIVGFTGRARHQSGAFESGAPVVASSLDTPPEDVAENGTDASVYEPPMPPTSTAESTPAPLPAAKPVASFRPRNCRIVPQKDASGRVVFREVCQ